MLSILLRMSYTMQMDGIPYEEDLILQRNRNAITQHQDHDTDHDAHGHRSTPCFLASICPIRRDLMA